MAKNLGFGALLEIYGAMLTEKQRSVMESYYWEDLSLGEIAEVSGITRQGVRDSIKRSEQLLTGFEAKLGLAEKINRSSELFADICEACDENASYDTIKEIALRGRELL